jgi:hypothetical protein
MTQDQLQTAAIMRAQDISYRDIEAAIGVDHSVIHKQFQKDELNQLIKQAQNDLIKNALQDAVKNQVKKIKLSTKITDQINNNQELAQGSIKALELGHDCERQLLQSVGIHNAHTQSITLNNILVDNRSELSPAVEALLMSRLGEPGKVGDDVIDITPERQEGG